jgi:uncharacterized membrane protein YeaQ/YmgE (transglycosylase-associated protein family)
MKTEDPEIARMLRACEEPRGWRYALVLGLVGAFAAGGVVFVAITRTASLHGWAGVLFLVAMLMLGASKLWRKGGGRPVDVASDPLEPKDPAPRRRAAR